MKNWKRLIAALLALVLCIGQIPAVATPAHAAGVGYSEGLSYALSEDGKSYIVTGIGSCTDTDLVIPDTYNDLPITAIESSAFHDCTQLISVTLPDSIVTIGDKAFWQCSELVRINIPNGVETIGHLAFYWCLQLENVSLPASLTSMGMNPFNYCTALKSFAVDAGNNTYCTVDDVIYTKDMKTLVAYPAAKEDTSFEIPAGVTTIADSAFEAARNLTSITIPETVTTLRNGGFHNCSGLTTITIPASVTNIEENVFENCDNLTEIIVADANQNYCAQDGVLYTKDMTTFVWYPAGKPDTTFAIPDGVTTLAASFRNCQNLTHVTIPHGVTELRPYTFNWCLQLTSVTLPSTITSLGHTAFECPDLTDIYYAGTEEKWNEIQKEDGWNIVCWDGTIGNFTIHYGVNCQQNHTWTEATCTAPKHCSVCGLTEGEALGHSYVDDQCVNCGRMAYSTGLEYMLDGDHYVVTGIGSCTDTDLVIPSTFNGLPVAVIGSNAFADCTHLTSITLPDTIITIEEYAFAWCHQLQSVNIPYGVTTIGECAFVWCGNLAEIIIPTTVTSIGDSAFHGCSKLTQIHIPANVANIGYGVFGFCYELGQITVDADNAFYCDVDSILYTKDMTTLVCYPANKPGDSFTVPTSVTTLAYRAFMYADLSEIILPQSLVAIRGSAFEYCSNLQSITIPAGVVEIHSGCFEGCYNLTQILVEQGNARYCSVNGVLYTADMKTLVAYPSGSANTSYTIPDGTTNIFQRAFFECGNLQEVIIPGTVSTIPNSAFEGCRALTNVVIGPGVATIDDWAFGNCEDLATISIPASVTKIGFCVFYNCSNLDQILYAGTEEAWNAIPKGDNWNKDTGDYQMVYSAFCNDGHTWADATCATPKHCVNCGLTEGEALEHNFVDGICTVCGRSCYSEGLEYKLDGDHYLVTGIGSCTDTDLVIPSTFNGLPVTVIGDRAFENCSHLTSITLPESIHTLGDYAFNFCTSLQSINIPSAVTKLTVGIFQACDSLTALVIPANVSSIEAGTFEGCRNLSQIQVEKGNKYYCSVDDVLYTAKMDVLMCYPANKQDTHYTVPSTVTVIEDGAFYGARSLQSIDLPEGLITISCVAFSDCYSLKNVIIPSTVQTIEDSAFQACSSLTSITIPANVQYMGVPTFYGCTALTEILVEKDNPNYYSIAGVLFTADGKELITYPASKADNVYVVPAGVENISRNAFGYAQNLQELVMPSGLKTIGNFAVAFCYNLSSITLPASLTSVGTSAFRYDKALAEIRYAGAEQMWNAISFGKNWDGSAGKYTVYYSVFCDNGHTWTDATCTAPKHCVNCGLTEGETLEHNFVDSICTVCGRVDYHGKMVKIYYPSGDTYVTSQFSDNRLNPGNRSEAAVWSVASDENGYYTFCIDGQYLTSLETGNGLYLTTELSDYSRWEWIAVEGGCYLRNIAADFKGNPQYLEYYKGFTTYGFNAEKPAIYIFQLIVVEGCEAYGHSWSNATCQQQKICSECGSSGGMGDHNIVNGTCSICGETISVGLEYALEGDHYVVIGIGSCTDSDLVIPGSYNGLPVTAIATEAFWGCDTLTSVVLPSSIIRIGVYAFGMCDNLTSIHIPDGVLEISEFAFSLSNMLSSLSIPASVTSIGYGFASDCASLSQITVDENNAFYCDGDGVVYSKDMTTLLCYPEAKAGDSFEIPYGVTTIETYAFERCRNLTSITIPDTVTTIKTSGFHNCHNLVSITIPASVTSIGNAVFENCESLTEIIVEDDNKNYCSQDGVLYDESKTKLICYPAGKAGSDFTIPAGVLTLGAGSFRGVHALLSVVVPNSVTTIDESTFQNCYNLTKLTIPTSVTYIGSMQFTWNNNEISIFYGGSADQWEAISKHEEWNWKDWDGNYANITIYFDVNCEDNGHSWADATCTKPETCFYCGITQGTATGHSFVDGVCTICKAVDLDGKVVKIYHAAADRYMTSTCANEKMWAGFRGNSATWTMTEVSDGVFTFNYGGMYLSAYENRGGLTTSWNLTDYAKWKVVVVENGYYISNVGMNGLYIAFMSGFSGNGYSENQPENYTFQLVVVEGCEATGHQWNDASCVEIRTCEVCGLEDGFGDHCFENDTCTGCYIKLSQGLTYAEYYDHCGRMIGYTVTGIGDCSDSVVVIPDTFNGQPVVAIAEQAFDACTNLVNIIMPRTIRFIGNYAFRGCTGLINITIPDNVEQLGGAAFENCTGLTTMVLENEPELLWIPVLRNCTSLTEIFVHSETYAALSYGNWSSLQFAEYAECVYLLDSLGTMSDTFAQGYACKNGYEVVTRNGFTYKMYTKNAHNLLENDRMEPTCTENGYIAYQCADCGCTISETLLANGHNYNGDYVCTVCGYAPNYLAVGGMKLEELVLGNDGAYYTPDGYAVSIAINASNDYLGQPLSFYVNNLGEDYFSMTYWEQLLAITNEDGYAPLTQESLVWLRDLITGNPNWGEDETFLPNYLVFRTKRTCEDKGHTWTNATCTTPKTCSTCGATEGEPLDHNYVDGLCTVCGTILTPSEAMLVITAESVRVLTGNWATITLRVEQNPGFQGMSFYPVIKDAKGNLVSWSWEVDDSNSALAFDVSVGTMVVLSADTNCDGTGVLLDIRFFVSEEVELGEYTISFRLYNGECFDVEDNAVPAALPTVSVKVTDVVYGDADGDGHVTLRDVLLLRQYLANSDPVTGESTVYVEAGADANGDGSVTLRDVLLLRQYLANRDLDTGESTVVLGPM